MAVTKKIKHSGPKQKKIPAAQVAQLLGAEALPGLTKHKRGPLAAAALREFVRRQLRSTGGRPALAGTDQVRRKVPLFREDLEKLELLARRFSDEKRKVSPLQVAACIVHRALQDQ